MGSPTQRREKYLVYIVERHPIAARHLEMVLNANRALEVVLSDVDLRANATLSRNISVLVIDGSALPFPLAAFLRTARTVFADAPTLVIGNRLSDDDLCRLLFHGVKGYVAYDKVEQEVCAAVEAVVAGRVWAPRRVLERYVMLTSAAVNEKRGGHNALSPRENEVMGLLQRRLSNKEIGGALGISERTVRFHLQNIFAKLGVHDRYSVVELARGADSTESDDETPTRKTALSPMSSP